MNFKDMMYDELSRVLTDYEEDEIGEDDLYEMLVKIQNNWEIITSDEDE